MFPMTTAFRLKVFDDESFGMFRGLTNLITAVIMLQNPS